MIVNTTSKAKSLFGKRHPEQKENEVHIFTSFTNQSCWRSIRKASEPYPDGSYAWFVNEEELISKGWIKVFIDIKKPLIAWVTYTDINMYKTWVTYTDMNLYKKGEMRYLNISLPHITESLLLDNYKLYFLEDRIEWKLRSMGILD